MTKRHYNYCDKRRGKVFVLTQWAEYALYELGGALLEPEEYADAIAAFKEENNLEQWEIDALVAFAKEYGADYHIFNGDAERVIELDSGRIALADGEYSEDYDECDRDIAFLEDYPACPYRSVYLPSVLVYAVRRKH